jgi:hypothetical protein
VEFLDGEGRAFFVAKIHSCSNKTIIAEGLEFCVETGGFLSRVEGFFEVSWVPPSLERRPKPKSLASTVVRIQHFDRKKLLSVEVKEQLIVNLEDNTQFAFKDLHTLMELEEVPPSAIIRIKDENIYATYMREETPREYLERTFHKPIIDRLSKEEEKEEVARKIIARKAEVAMLERKLAELE